ncbi:hypothetical protein JCM17960_33700 [Magnetospira thiophila]
MITDDVIDQVINFVARNGIDATKISDLRAQVGGIHVTHCMDDDIGENARPVRETPDFNVYLVDSSDHCLRLTPDREIATGLVIAEVEV